MDQDDFDMNEAGSSEEELPPGMHVIDGDDEEGEDNEKEPGDGLEELEKMEKDLEEEPMNLGDEED